jgi:hypothetical protein
VRDGAVAVLRRRCRAVVAPGPADGLEDDEPRDHRDDGEEDGDVDEQGPGGTEHRHILTDDPSSGLRITVPGVT